MSSCFLSCAQCGFFRHDDEPNVHCPVYGGNDVRKYAKKHFPKGVPKGQEEEVFQGVIANFKKILDQQIPYMNQSCMYLLFLYPTHPEIAYHILMVYLKKKNIKVNFKR